MRQNYGMTHAELKVKGCTAEIYVNDIPLKRLDANSQLFISIPANQYVRQGKNLLEVVVFPGPTPARCRELQGLRDVKGASIRARLVTFRDGEFTGGDAGQVAGEINWQGDAAATTPIILSAETTPLSSAGPWAWESAPILSLQTSGNELIDEIQRLHVLFRDGNATGLLSSMATFVAESARAYPAWTLSEIRDRITSGITSNAGRQDWVEDLNPAKFSLRLCAGGRMVDCVDEDWLPVLRTKPQPDGDMYPFPFFLGRGRNGFEILR